MMIFQLVVWPSLAESIRSPAIGLGIGEHWQMRDEDRGELR